MERAFRALGKATTASLAQNRIINLDFTIAAAKAFATSLAPQVKGSAFRFVYVSGAATEKDPEKSLWFAGDLRKMRVRYQCYLFIMLTISACFRNNFVFVSCLRPNLAHCEMR